MHKLFLYACKLPTGGNKKDLLRQQNYFYSVVRHDMHNI